MKHTECVDCELGNGDCGHHFRMDGVTNYDIASLSACDQYGNCYFFKSKAKPQGDLISRRALEEVINDLFITGEYDCNSVLKAIDNAPTVDLTKNQAYDKGFITAMKLYARPQGDLKSCEALKAYARKVLCGDNPTNSLIIRMFDEIIDKAPAAVELEQVKTELNDELNELNSERPQGEV